MNVCDLTADLVAIRSESELTNLAAVDRADSLLGEAGFCVERLSYVDARGVEKFNLLAKKGNGPGGIGFFSHIDTVPGGDGWDPFDPRVDGGRLYGRGSCDMKGPLAASIVAAARVDASDLKHPVFISVTADEEIGHVGARHVIAESATLEAGWPDYAVICEPSLMTPVYAHKGSTAIVVTAHGIAAHSSTDRGESANFEIAPFLADMARLAEEFGSDPKYRNDEFDPPTNGFNMVINDGGTASNVTAEMSECTLNFRAMPDAAADEVRNRILDRAGAYGLEVSESGHAPFYADRNSTLARLACELTGHERAITVPYGTEAVWFQEHAETIVMGPGDIAQAHTTGEFIELAQLELALEVYGKLINRLCY